MLGSRLRKFSSACKALRLACAVGRPASTISLQSALHTLLRRSGKATSCRLASSRTNLLCKSSLLAFQPNSLPLSAVVRYFSTCGGASAGCRRSSQVRSPATDSGKPTAVRSLAQCCKVFSSLGIGCTVSGGSFTGEAGGSARGVDGLAGEEGGSIGEVGCSIREAGCLVGGAGAGSSSSSRASLTLRESFCPAEPRAWARKRS